MRSPVNSPNGRIGRPAEPAFRRSLRRPVQGPADVADRLTARALRRRSADGVDERRRCLGLRQGHDRPAEPAAHHEPLNLGRGPERHGRRSTRAVRAGRPHPRDRRPLSIFPHFENPDLPWNTMATAERWTAGMPGAAYAIADQTALKVTNGTVDVVSEGHWKLLTPKD